MRNSKEVGIKFLVAIASKVSDVTGKKWGV